MVLKLIPPGERGHKFFAIRGRVTGTGILIERSTGTLDPIVAQRRLRELERHLADLPTPDEIAFAQDATGYIYFIGSDDGCVKIGYSINPPHRLKALQTGTGATLSLLAEMRGRPEHERQLHIRFAPYRIRREWFRFEGELRAYVFGLVRGRLHG